MSYHLNPTILRAYDIRGIIGETLVFEDAFAIGRAFGWVIKSQGKGKIAVGYDGRHSSPQLKEQMLEGLKQSGIEVSLLEGVSPTPLLYYAMEALEVDGGIMITGSHNPANYNGFKFVLNKKPFFGQAIIALGQLAENIINNPLPYKLDSHGTVKTVNLLEGYTQRLLKDLKIGGKELKVVWDPGNGATGKVVEHLTSLLPGTHILINAHIDGSFPAHHPDPTVEKNLKDLQEAVKAERADLGIAFDGDGDRIGVVDGKGRMLYGDQLLLLYARDLLKNHPGAQIIADVKASQVLFNEIEKLGGVPLMSKTGHSFIKEKIGETGALLAGEMSGHVFFKDTYYGYDDALYAALRLLSLLAHSDPSLSEMLDTLPKVYNTPELRFSCAEELKFKVVDQIKENLYQKGIIPTTLDGIRVTTKEGWWILRASNTQDVLTARIEAQTPEGLDSLKKMLDDVLKEVGFKLPSH